MPRSLCLLLALAVCSAAWQQRSASEDEAAIRAIEARWDAANLKGDAATLASIFADEFIATDGDGVVRTKAEVVGELKAGNIRYQSARTEDVRVILHGDAAVVTGTWRGAYSYKGTPKSLVERFTNFYVRRNGRWRCVAAHGSTIR